MPRVSVIIPTHSRPHLLPRAVKSAWAAGRDVEVIVVDDASTDATAQVCHTLKGIKYIRLERNQGVAGARNVGILETWTRHYRISFGRVERSLSLGVLCYTMLFTLTNKSRSMLGFPFGTIRLRTHRSLME